MKSPKQTAAAKRFWLRAAEHSIGAVAADASSELGEGDVVFQTLPELRSATTEWATTRLVTLWNGLPGVVPIRKFTDRATALKRIWSAIQDLTPAPTASPDQTRSHAAHDKPRAATKKQQALTLLARAEGATIAELVAALGWQSHSVRGFLSTVGRKDLPIHSHCRSTGERAYSVTAPEAKPEETE